MTFIVAVLALVIGGAIGFAWHAPGKPGTWDDIRTWVGFAVVVIGIVIALVQLDMQRRQLAGQQSVLEGEVERNKRRDVLLDGQLRELEQRARSLDRQQAESIGFRPSSFDERVPDSQPPMTRNLHMADVQNDSPRPIRDVTCRIEPEPGDALQATCRVGLYLKFRGGSVAFPCLTVRISRSSG